MKVMLVAPIIAKDPAVINCPHPQVGDIDTAVAIWNDGRNDYYQLERFPEDHGFICEKFATLPDVESEVINEQEKQAIVNLETAVS